MKVEQEDSGFEAAWTAHRACLRSDAPDDRQSFKAGWNAAKGFKPIIITLETEEEAACVGAMLTSGTCNTLPDDLCGRQHAIALAFEDVYDARKYGKGE